MRKLVLLFALTMLLLYVQTKTVTDRVTEESPLSAGSAITPTRERTAQILSPVNLYSESNIR